MNRSIIKYHSGHAEVFFASSSRQALYRCNIVLAEVFGDFVLLIGASGEGQGLYESFVGSDWVFTVDKINHTVQWGPREVAKIHHSCAYFNSAKDVLEFSSTLIEVAGHVGRTARLTACSIATARQLLSSSVENQVSASIVDNIPVPSVGFASQDGVFSATLTVVFALFLVMAVGLPQGSDGDIFWL